MSTRFSAEMSRSRYLRCEVLEWLILLVGLYLLWELFCCRLQVLLVLLEDGRLVVLFEIVGEDIGVHQRPPALTEDVEGLFQELNLDPRHVVLLHLLHLILHHRTQLGLELQGLQVVHVPGQVPCIRYREQAHASPVAVEEVSLKSRSAGFLIVPVTLGFVLIVPVSDVHERVSQCSRLPVAVVPRATMWLPGSKAHPTEVSLDVWIDKNLGKNCFTLQLWFLQIMWLQPPSFSMVAPHCIEWMKSHHQLSQSIMPLSDFTYLWALLGVGRDPIACLATHLKRLAQRTIIQFTSG